MKLGIVTHDIFIIKYGMKERTVFYDNNLLDLYLKMPPEYRADESTWKNAIKILDNDMARVVDNNTGLSSFAPYPIVFIKGIDKRARMRMSRDFPYTDGSWPNFSSFIRHNSKYHTVVLLLLETANKEQPGESKKRIWGLQAGVCI